MMGMRVFLILLAGWLGVLRGDAGEAVHRGKGLRVTLVSEETAAVPGRTLHVGLWIEHDRGHHTYWKNPGLAGVATNLAWELPEGFTAGPIRWPAPEKVKMASIDTHGYERDTLLIVEIGVPAALRGSSVTLRTKASWMCCARTCAPGFCDLELTLPVAAAAAPDKRWAPRFGAARRQWPVALEGWSLTARREGGRVVLSGEPKVAGLKLPKRPQFFSDDNLICSHPVQEWTATEGGGFRAVLTISEMPPKDQSVLRGVLEGAGGWLAGGAGGAVTVAVPLSGS
jgi:thiol:disulfide interchange protein DsbD